jgi:hypothetical protein
VFIATSSTGAVLKARRIIRNIESQDSILSAQMIDCCTNVRIDPHVSFDGVVFNFELKHLLADIAYQPVAQATA